MKDWKWASESGCWERIYESIYIYNLKEHRFLWLTYDGMQICFHEFFLKVMLFAPDKRRGMKFSYVKINFVKVAVRMEDYVHIVQTSDL